MIKRRFHNQLSKLKCSCKFVLDFDKSMRNIAKLLQLLDDAANLKYEEEPDYEYYINNLQVLIEEKG